MARPRAFTVGFLLFLGLLSSDWTPSLAEDDEYRRENLPPPQFKSLTREQEAARNNAILRKRKSRGVFKKRQTSLAQVLFPGAAPENYDHGRRIPGWIEVVDSDKTQVPFEYGRLPICTAQPDAPSSSSSSSSSSSFRAPRKNLGAKLQGHDKKTLAPYRFVAKKDVPCTILCMSSLSGKDLKWMRKLVERQYKVHLSLDGLPLLMRRKELNFAFRGHPLGFKKPEQMKALSEDFYLYNHLHFTVTYREEPAEFFGIRVTGFEVKPVSIKHEFDASSYKPGDEVPTCPSDDDDTGTELRNVVSNFVPLRTGPTGEPLDVLFSYQVRWEKSDLPWADRWDVYLIGSPDNAVHYFSIVNSVAIVLCLSAFLGVIMVRTLRKDIAGYNAEIEGAVGSDAAEEESGWKLVHGDVFRPPSSHPGVLSVLVGTGTQLGISVALTLICAVLKLLNPLKKGQALSAVVVLYVLSGSIAGYVSSRVYKLCDGKDWKRNTILTAVGFPGLLVSMFLVLNVFLTVAGAATAVSFWTILAVFLLWVCVATPMVFLGAYFGFRAPPVEVPVKTNQIARFVPEPSPYVRPQFTVLVGGLLPFAAVSIELYFVLNSLWLHEMYYVMGSLLAVVLIVGVTAAEVAIFLCYLQLCAEDHRWWWRSFFNGASAGGYVLAYCLWYLSFKLNLVGVLPKVVYLTYMTMMSASFGIFCGAVGFLSCLWFARTIYGAVKVD